MCCFQIDNFAEKKEHAYNGRRGEEGNKQIDMIINKQICEHNKIQYKINIK